MPKYIKKETVGTVLLALEKTECSKNDLLNAIGMLAHILDTEAVDAVEVVRCKDCKYSHIDIEGNIICNSEFFVMDEDFCSCGKRKETK